MPYVSVNFKVIVDDSYEAVVKQYNKNKPSDWQPLAKLGRIEGGFQIDIPELKDKNDVNGRIKQVRWHKLGLRTRITDIPFSDEETKLLHDSMVTVFGKEKINWVDESSSYFSYS